MIDIDVAGQLIPNIWTIVVQLCSTLVLFLVIKKFLWKSIAKWLDARSDKMQAELAESEQAKKEALEDREKAKEELQNATKTSSQVIEAARKEANDEKEEILAQAKVQATGVLEKAQEQVASQKAAMQGSMQKEMVEIAMSAAGKLLGQKSDSETDRAAVDAFVKEAQDHGE